MKQIVPILSLVTAVGCSMRPEENIETQLEGQTQPQPAWSDTARSADLFEEEYPIKLGPKTPATQAFTVKSTHRWEGCESGEEPRVKVIFVCRLDDNGVRERCYSIEPTSADHQTDPYLSCDSALEPWQCTSQILANGSYHVGALYESASCSQYEFWWHGVFFDQRNLSAALVDGAAPLRHLDHRMAHVLETPAENDRYRYIGSVVHLLLDIEGAHSLYIQATGVDNIQNNGGAPCFRDLDGQYWCPNIEGQAQLDLFTSHAGKEVTVDASLDAAAPNVTPENAVRFVHIEPRWRTYLPFN